MKANDPAVADSHVLCDGCVADGVGGGLDGRLAAEAAAAAVQAGHVHAVQVVVVLPPSVAQRLVLAVVVAPANVNGRPLQRATARGGSPYSVNGHNGVFECLLFRFYRWFGRKKKKKKKNAFLF